jgi:hypothetical protein
MEATAIVNPATNKLVVSRREIKEVTLKYCVDTLTSNEPEEAFVEEIEKKKEIVKNFMKLKEGNFKAITDAALSSPEVLGARQTVLNSEISKSYIKTIEDTQDKLWAMQLGAGIDDDSYAAAYGKHNAKTKINVGIHFTMFSKNKAIQLNSSTS